MEIPRHPWGRSSFNVRRVTPSWDDRVQRAFVQFCADALAAALASRRLAPGDTFTMSLEIPPDMQAFLPGVLRQVADAAGVATAHTVGTQTFTMTKFIREVPATSPHAGEVLDRQQLALRLQELEETVAAQQPRRGVTVGRRVVTAITVFKAGEYVF